MRAGLAPALLARAVLVTGTCVEVATEPASGVIVETWEFRLHLGDGNGEVAAIDRVDLPSPTTRLALQAAAVAIYEPHGLDLTPSTVRPGLGIFTAHVHATAPPPS